LSFPASEAKLLSLLGRPDVISLDGMWTEWSYSRWRLRVEFVGSLCFGFDLGEIPVKLRITPDDDIF